MSQSLLPEGWYLLRVKKAHVQSTGKDVDLTVIVEGKILKEEGKPAVVQHDDDGVELVLASKAARRIYPAFGITKTHQALEDSDFTGKLFCACLEIKLSAVAHPKDFQIE